MKPFRFGVNTRGADTRAGLAERARKVEAQGYSTLLVPDHLADLFPPLLPLVTVAEATTSLRVGTFVLNNDFRHPVLLAREAATVDLLSDGRLELGIGAGHMQSEYEQAGLPFDPAPVRFERLGESVQILKSMLEGKTTTFDGRHYQVRAHKPFPLPRQQPRPPILIGGNGRRLLSLAAREADIVGLTGLAFPKGATVVDVSGFKPAAVDERVAWLRAEAGSRYESLELNVLVQRVIPTDNRRQTAEELAANWPALAAEDVLQTPYLLIGTVDEMAESLRLRRERWGISYVVTHEPYQDALAPVVTALAGQ
ncbi:MAG: TIGR03621 family F420-dependent LLM class oxidoreductase [Chloroflexota bacterium]